MTSYLVLKIWPFYGPGYWGGYLGASQPMLLCVALCPLINYVKTVKILAVKHYILKSEKCFFLRNPKTHMCTQLNISILWIDIYTNEWQANGFYIISYQISIILSLLFSVLFFHSSFYSLTLRNYNLCFLFKNNISNNTIFFFDTKFFL